MRNTVVIICALAILAALLVGINIGKRLGNVQPSKSDENTQQTTQNQQNSEIVAPIVEQTIPQISRTQFLVSCGISFTYYDSYSLTEASRAAVLTNTISGKTINIVCTEEIPLPPVSSDKVTTITIAGQKSNLYHDQDKSTGDPVDVIIFTHPINNLDIGIFGFGEDFKTLTESVELL